jgi:hypothetical protein
MRFASAVPCLLACFLVAYLGTLAHFASTLDATQAAQVDRIREAAPAAPAAVVPAALAAVIPAAAAAAAAPKRTAVATVVCDDSDVLPAAVLLVSLLKAGTRATLVPLLAPGVSAAAERALANLAGGRVDPRRVRRDRRVVRRGAAVPLRGGARVVADGL